MRYLLTSTLLATQHRPPLCGIQMFGDVQPQLAAEEYKALAGIWRADLKLGPVATMIERQGSEDPEVIRAGILIEEKMKLSDVDLQQQLRRREDHRLHREAVAAPQIAKKTSKVNV